MTSYKKMAEELATKVVDLNKQIDELMNLDEMVNQVTNEEAKTILASFGSRAVNRAELQLLLRVLSRIT